MSLIEGVGDEVTNFFIVVGVLLVAWFAWCSTNIADQPLIRTVLIFPHRTRTRIAELRANHQNNSTFNRPPNLEISEENSAEPISTNNSDTGVNCPDSSATDTSAVPSESERGSEAATSEEVLIEAMDSFNNDDTASLQRPAKANTSDPPKVTESESSTPVQVTENEVESSTNDISIKLKFINDDQKLVTGSLKEMLGDFKRRHFQMELEAQKLVRLVFNGQVLQPDSKTLERCGLYNNCVVHCLVHEPRPASVSSAQTSTLDNSSSIYFNPQPFQDSPASTGISSVYNEWDLSRFLVSIVTFILGLAWYSRYHYAQLFTATTTLALYGLTGIFAISLFSNFFPDQDGIRNIE